MPEQLSVSNIVHLFKQKYSGLYRSRRGLTSGRLWQHRFWDHIIRDEDDYARHLDYIHYNPVRHGLAHSPLDYPLSSYRQWVARGYYDCSWGLREDMEFDGDFGE